MRLTRRIWEGALMHRIRGVAVVVVVFGFLWTACSSSDSDGDGESARAATTQAPTSTTAAAAQPPDPEAARAEITTAFESFLDGTKPREERIAFVEDADELAEVFAAGGDAEPAGVTGQVANIAFTGAESATVLFDILVDGTVALPNFPGEAVFVDGAWKVSRTTVCDLIAQSGTTCPA